MEAAMSQTLSSDNYFGVSSSVFSHEKKKQTVYHESSRDNSIRFSAPTKLYGY
jgi:hypothetical protein